MTKQIKNILFLILILGCTTHSSTSKKVQHEKDEWKLLNRIQDEQWNSEKLAAILGKPDSILRDDKNKQDFWIYQDRSLDVQKWSIGVFTNGKISSVTFFPNITNRDLFSKSNAKNYWGSTCSEKKEKINKKDFIDNIYFLDCGEGRRVYLNNLGEISSLHMILK